MGCADIRCSTPILTPSPAPNARARPSSGLPVSGVRQGSYSPARGRLLAERNVLVYIGQRHIAIDTLESADCVHPDVFRQDPASVRLPLESLDPRLGLRDKNVLPDGFQLPVLGELVPPVVCLCRWRQHLYYKRRIEQRVLLVVGELGFTASRHNVRVRVHASRGHPQASFGRDEETTPLPQSCAQFTYQT